MSKNIILGISINHGIIELITKNLIYHGFNVVNVSDPTGKEFKYPSLWARIVVKIRRKLLGDKQAKRKLESKIAISSLEKQIQGKQFDYALFFLAQTYSLELIQYVKQHVKPGGMINYQWDGLNRYPDIFERLPFFDRLFVFDPADLNHNSYSPLPTTSFYFDDDLVPLPILYDFYFLGAHLEERKNIICQFAEFAKQHNLKLNFQLAHKRIRNIRQDYPDNIQLIRVSDQKTFAENLILSRQSRVLVDFVSNAHKGLSLRIFEALGHDKKLITTNTDIKEYDFYHPNNIFVLENNFDQLLDFLAKPYIPVPTEIKQKYSFGNWIRYVLNIQPHQPILLPNIVSGTDL
ncbi:hypothetical protein [Lonepinella sp. BR2474]|uniref:hypothetical protein n=1 Tax=Lonepinella sp. BR2474 TaxID=3434548 RepID=UPI003F6E35D0